MKIYTRKGDDGTSALIGGARISKDDLIFHTMGEIDELNSLIGVLKEKIKTGDEIEVLSDLQHQLFSIGAFLAMFDRKDDGIEQLSKKEIWLSQLEKEIDRMDEKCAPLTQFILPSGSEAIAQAHVCRSVCRRVERTVASLQKTSGKVGSLCEYFNRLSDYFFVLARKIAVNEEVQEVVWDQNK